MRIKQWHKTFLKALRDCGNVRMACEAAGINRTTAYKARDANLRFRADWDKVVQEAIDELEREAWRRAVQGVTRTEPIMYQGEQVAEKVITEYSDKLMELLLKANRPAKFREQIKIITEREVDDTIDRALREHNLPIIETTATVSDVPQ